MKDLIDQIQIKLGVSFNNREVITTALTHKSTPEQVMHNERLEFLGDSILNLAISDYLYQHFPSHDEGMLSRMRARLVNKTSLSDLAITLNLSKYILTGACEKKTDNKHYQQSILANTIEAIIGALYLDQGFQEAFSWIIVQFKPIIDEHNLRLAEKDAKTQLQEYCHQNQLSLPEYKIHLVRGPKHKQFFIIHCTLTDKSITTEGQGALKRTAEQQAAQALLTKLNQGKNL
jgi:ribonuclease III